MINEGYLEKTYVAVRTLLVVHEKSCAYLYFHFSEKKTCNYTVKTCNCSTKVSFLFDVYLYSSTKESAYQ